MNDNYLRLWYRQPAKKWTEALPIGNGRFGAMVSGDPRRELIQLNEDTLWSGYPHDTNVPKANEYLESVRKLIFENKIEKAEDLLKEKMMGPYTQSYLPLGNLILENQNSFPYNNFERELDLQTAIIKSQYIQANTNYNIQIFSSNPDQAIIFRFAAKGNQKINTHLKIECQLYHQIRYQNNLIVVQGNCPSNMQPNYVHKIKSQMYEEGKGMHFEFQLKVDVVDGTLIWENDTLFIENCTQVTIYMVAATSFNGFDKDPDRMGQDPTLICNTRMKKVLNQTYEQLRKNHIQDYQSLFQRMEINLGANENATLPTDVRINRLSMKKRNFITLLLRNFKKNPHLEKILENAAETFDDPQLISLYFQYGRYLLIASSRPGTQAANLQGIWNEKLRPPWSSNYTININTEMNYWPVEVCNLSECAEPLVDFISELSHQGQKTAQNHYNCRGWTAHHNSDLWRLTNPVSGNPKWAIWPMGGVWLCLNLWEHYSFTLNRSFLEKTAYPILKGATLFCLDWLIKDPESDYLITCPSTSPENEYFSSEKKRYQVSKGTTCDIGLIRELLSIYLEAANTLGLDSSLSEKVEIILQKLYPFQIGQDGRLQEWYYEFKDVERGHRHKSHLISLYPGKAITVERTPILAQAAAKSLQKRIEFGGGATGWSCAWKINLFARLKNQNMAYNALVLLLRQSTYPNLFDAHPPFQIDGNWGGIAGIAEMFVQSHLDYIELLPALPLQFKNGSIKGLKARGNFQVDIVWEDNQLKRALITPKFDGMCSIKANWPITVSIEGNQITSTKNPGEIITFSCVGDAKYEISNSKR